MGLSIKHAETERKVRAIAERRGQSMTRVIHDLAAEALEKTPSNEADVRARFERFMAFAHSQDGWQPDPLPTRTEMDGWVYDAEGNPSR